VSENSERGHQQSQHDDAVLIIAVELLQETCQPQQPSYLEHVDLSTLQTQYTFAKHP